MNPSGSLDPTPLNSVLTRALNGDPDAWGVLAPTIRAVVRGHARRTAVPPGRSSEFVDDVSQDVVVVLMTSGPGAFDNTRASARTFLTIVARCCAARYFAFRPVVGKRRPRTRNKHENLATTRVVSLDDLPEKCVASHSEPAIGIDSVLDAQTILNEAPQIVATALRGLHYEDRTQIEIARILGVTRTTLMRHIDTYATRVRGTLAA